MRVLLTGGYGCIGSWITRNLLERGDRVFIYDLKEDPRRLKLILPAEKVRQIGFVPEMSPTWPAYRRPFKATKSRT